MSNQKQKNIFVILPAYNEEESLLTTLHQIPRETTSSYVISSLVVDNNSSDNTFLLASKHSDYVIRECRRGYGQAVHSGILEAKRKGADIIVVLDADGSDPPQNIPLIIEPILSEKADFVLGQRLHLAEDGALTSLQKFGNRFACRLMTYVVQKKYRDLGSLRAISIAAFELLDMEDDNFGWNIEMQIKAVQKKLRIVEIDVPYQKRNGGNSKISENPVRALQAGAMILHSVIKYGIF